MTAILKIVFTIFFLVMNRQRQENAARAVERDRRHWESVQKNWHATTEADKAHVEMRLKVIRDPGWIS